MNPMQQNTSINQLSKSLGLRKSDLKNQMQLILSEKSKDIQGDLPKIISSMAQPTLKGEATYEWFIDHGGRFYRDADDIIYLFYDGMQYVMDGNQKYSSLIYKLTKTAASATDGRILRECLKNRAYDEAEKIDFLNWIYTDKINSEIYLNLNNSSRQIIKITPNGNEVLENGNNPKKIMLKDSQKIKPIEYTHLSKQQEKKALELLKELFFNNLACSVPNRYLISCWLLGYIFMDFARSIPILRFEGPSGCGKSRGMDNLSYLIYGESELSKPTVAANYSIASQNPLLLLDNVETNNLSTPQNDFLLIGSTGGKREKRKGGTESGTTNEILKALIVTSGIESFVLKELISRAFLIKFDRWKYANDNYTDMIYDEIAKHRNIIMSAIYMMASRVFMRINNKDSLKVAKELQKYDGFRQDDRAATYISFMALFAEELIDGFDEHISIDELLKKWFDYQKNASMNNMVNTNQIVQLLEALAYDYKKELDRHQAFNNDNEFVSDYPDIIEIFNQEIRIDACSRDLSMAQLINSAVE